MDTESVFSKLESTLRTMTVQAEALARLIAEEGYALRDANIETLNLKVQQKQKAVSQLTQTDQEFRSILKKLDPKISSDINLFLEKIDDRKSLSTLWREYLKRLQQCDTQNQENNSLVTIGMRHTSHALEFLQSCIGEHHETVYGSRGQKLPHSNQNIIAKA